jgi:hypothetical protein
MHQHQHQHQLSLGGDGLGMALIGVSAMPASPRHGNYARTVDSAAEAMDRSSSCDSMIIFDPKATSVSTMVSFWILR